MRKIIFIFLIFVSVFSQEIFSSPRFDFVDFKFASELTLPAQSSAKKRAFSASTGLKIHVSDLFFVSRIDARSYITLPKTQFDTFCELDDFQDFVSLFGDVRYGIGLSLFEDFVPVQLKAGKISYSKSISKLRNPAPSSAASPLRKSFSFSPGTGSSLPTLTSSSQPKSVALSVSLPKERFILPLRAEMFFAEGKNFAVSASASHAFGKFLSVQAAVTGAGFFVENNSSILKKCGASFEETFLLAGICETHFRTPFLKANFSCAIYQSPYEQIGAWLRLDGRAAYKSALLDFSFFALPTAGNFPSVAPLVCIDSSVLRTLQSAAVNPQYVFFLPGKNAPSLRLGLSAYESMKICATKGAESLCVGKFSFGAEYESSAIDLKLDFSAANLLFSGNPPNKSSTPEKYFSVSLAGSLVRPLFSTAFSAGAKYYPPYDSASADKKSIALNLSFVPKKLALFSFQSGFDMVFKDWEKTSACIDSGICVRAKSKSVSSSVKCTFLLPF